MKCPKCGYLGFETTDRCRNCQYDFSLTPFISESDLTLHGADHKVEGPDLDLPAVLRANDFSTPARLDLDRLFGDAEPVAPAAAPTLEPPAGAALDARAERKSHEPGASVGSAVEELTSVAMPFTGGTSLRQPQPSATTGAAADEGALPFEDGPILPPPAARPPLAVRRSSEVPRNRPRTTRPVRTLDLESTVLDKSDVAAHDAADTVASLMELPSLGARVGAGLIDLLLLVGIDVAVLYLTLRVTGLQDTLEDMRVLPSVPFVSFLATLAFGYVAAFTVAGGQTIGKMILNLRVIGDDGRPVDAAGGMLRALGCMLVPITLGISYLPALFTSDHRALHDRLAGTRVVQE